MSTGLARVSDSMEAAPQALQLAEQLARTDFVPKALRGNAPAVMAAILTGRELGIPPMHSLRAIYMVEGKPTLSAELQRGLIRAAGHTLRTKEWTSRKVTLVGRRAGEEHEESVTWEWADAERAGLARKDVWRRYPKAMLLARATSTLAGLMFSDVTLGLAAPEDFDLLPSAEWEREEPEPAEPPAKVKRRRATKAPAAGGTEGPSTPPKRGGKSPAAAPPPLPDELEVVDAEVVEDAAPDDPPEPPLPAERTDAQRLHIHGAKAGLDEDARRDLFEHVSGGRTRHAAELTETELAVARSVIDDLEDGAAVLGYTAEGTATFSPAPAPRDTEAGSGEPTYTEADLIDLAAAVGASAAQVLMRARELADAGGVAKPRSVAEVAANTALARATLTALEPPF